ncbi:hypothetical protein [Aeromicrobium alkaliterrae]|uniref:Uncharacterized protein n=1 Tax=Aeromicrobium alkaliterrae TaxID=302168 RepID=A0ABP4VGN2_9ACTN
MLRSLLVFLLTYVALFVLVVIPFGQGIGSPELAVLSAIAVVITIVDHRRHHAKVAARG